MSTPKSRCPDCDELRAECICIDKCGFCGYLEAECRCGHDHDPLGNVPATPTLWKREVENEYGDHEYDS